MTPRFSILHPTKRFPDGWKASMEAWRDRAAHPETVEYILAVDEADWEKVDWQSYYGYDRQKHVRLASLGNAVNTGEQCSTQAYNAAAKHAIGDLLVCGADDVFPPQDWDRLILGSPLPRATDLPYGYWTPPILDWLPQPPAYMAALCPCHTVAHLSPNRDFLLHPGTGQPARDRRIVFQPIMSRGRYERLGYFFYPEYRAMFADNDLTEAARQDGVVIPLSGVQLEHRHPIYGTAPMDEVYAHENKPENYDLGYNVFLRRNHEGFHPVPRIPGWMPSVNRFILDRLIQEHEVKTVLEKIGRAHV